jgi:hypothetical protein
MVPLEVPLTFILAFSIPLPVASRTAPLKFIFCPNIDCDRKRDTKKRQENLGRERLLHFISM